MPIRTYHLTATAEKHFWEALEDTKQRWGLAQAEKYRVKFLQGLQYIADHHASLSSAHRAEMAQGTDFKLHLVAQRYVAFQAYRKNAVIIAGIFHERMDIPAHLRELQRLSQDEIALLKRQIAG